MKPRALLLPILISALLCACDLPAADQQAAQQSPAQTRRTQTPQSRTRQTQIPQTQIPQTQIPQSQPRQASRDPQSGLRWVNAGDLPREGAQLLQSVARGGPFRYGKDGVTFGNREHILPRQPSTYYREYTVPTPGEGDRGARRIVCGGQPVTRTAECYYTADHYASFRRIRP